MSDKKALLEVKDLQVDFLSKRSRVTAIHDINFCIESGTVLGVVGESGCGKSVTATTILRLLPKQTSVIAKGEILFEGKDIAKMSESELCSIRGKNISMIFQDPMTALNPVYTIGAQLIEMTCAHNRGISRSEAFERGTEMLEKVGIPSPRMRMKDYPHQLSGGMRQRVMIAMALSCKPSLLIADEPTTALDVTIQAQILDLIRNLKDETGTAVMMITHDLGVIANIADYVMVMYAGEIVEYGTVAQILEAPMHP
ncbi:MAG: ABC transporter ATP-binding protein, partial [Oscillospiraceae bacterium]